MKTVLITAFEPYDQWRSNSSWLAVVELTRQLPAHLKVVTRLYPVDFAAVQERLAADLGNGFDFALHLGQAPGSGRIRLEQIGLNIGGSSRQSPSQYRALDPEGPVAYRSPLPLANWATRLQEAGIPAEVSYHAGTFLCNATLYWSCHLTAAMGLSTQAAFIHLPLDLSQTVGEPPDLPALPASLSATALLLLLDAIPDTENLA